MATTNVPSAVLADSHTTDVYHEALAASSGKAKQNTEEADLEALATSLEAKKNGGEATHEASTGSSDKAKGDHEVGHEASTSLSKSGADNEESANAAPLSAPISAPVTVSTNAAGTAKPKYQFGMTSSVGKGSAPLPNPVNTAVNASSNDFHREITNRVRRQLEDIETARLANMSAEIKSASTITQDLIEAVIRNIRAEYAADVREAVYREFEPTTSVWKNLVEKTLKTELHETVKRDLKIELKNEAKSELKGDLREEAKNELKDELRAATKSDLHEELKDEARAELKADMKASVEGELRMELIKKLLKRETPDEEESPMRGRKRSSEEADHQHRDTTPKRVRVRRNDGYLLTHQRPTAPAFNCPTIMPSIENDDDVQSLRSYEYYEALEAAETLGRLGAPADANAAKDEEEDEFDGDGSDYEDEPPAQVFSSLSGRKVREG